MPKVVVLQRQLHSLAAKEENCQVELKQAVVQRDQANERQLCPICPKIATNSKSVVGLQRRLDLISAKEGECQSMLQEVKANLRAKSSKTFLRSYVTRSTDFEVFTHFSILNVFFSKFQIARSFWERS